MGKRAYSWSRAILDNSPMRSRACLKTPHFVSASVKEAGRTTREQACAVTFIIWKRFIVQQRAAQAIPGELVDYLNSPIFFYSI
jgi:hypothetical protein